MSKRRVGIVGYGSLGQFLAHKIIDDQKISAELEIAFIWNRSVDKITSDSKIDKKLILEDLSQFPSRGADIIVEVAHPDITAKYGVEFLKHADFYVGSPTAFADPIVDKSVREAATKYGIYVPAGALWGAEDIKKMADRGTLKGLTVTMKKHPDSLKVLGPLQAKLDAYTPDAETVLFEGSVRDLCPLAPNNVNTMACASLAGHNLGFDGTKARLVADPRLNSHVIAIEVVGPSVDGLGNFAVKTERVNPAAPGAVTGTQTYVSFLSSLLKAHGRGSGLHFC